MVFESLVVEILNRFLGDYVENLDSKQLKIGIWGGDVVLHNLLLKQTALDELDLPVKTVYGQLGKLVLKIPWKNLYGAPVEAEVDSLFLLAVPNQDVRYDPVKEEKWARDAKQSELTRVEEAKKKEAAKGKPAPDDSFVEKLTTQIIKNVQITIKNIHVRYEDKISDPTKPYSLGLSLSNLSVLSTDEKWQEAIVQDGASKIFKILRLDGLSAYWNIQTPLFSSLPSVDITAKFREGIASKTNNPVGYSYILGPINANARLQLHPKPETDPTPFTVPKVLLNLEMDMLTVAINQYEYQSIIMLVESMGRMSRGLPYRKYRPITSGYRGHYKEWWKFAYVCILEQEVQRRRNNWDWNHIAKHRGMCRQYAEAYKSKLQNPKISGELQKTIEECEMKLDIFNLVIIRQRMQMEVETLGKIAKERAQKQSWWGSWFGSAASAEDKELKTATDIMKQFEAEMTPAEKEKLYKAIDYTANTGPAEYPESYVGMSLAFSLLGLDIEIRDSDMMCVLSSKLKGVKCRLTQRPAADALKVNSKIDSFTVFGLVQNGKSPELVMSKMIDDDTALVDVLFETNPIDKACTQRFHLFARPLQITYDAQTIIAVVDVFKTPNSIALEELQAVANSKLANIKEMSTIGLEHAIQKHSHLELVIELSAPYIIIPENGYHTGSEAAIVINLGNFNMSTLPRNLDVITVGKMFKEGSTEDEILKTMISQSYDYYKINITDMQIVVTMKGEDWMEAITGGNLSDMHLLQPTNLEINIALCLVEDDPRLPSLRIAGNLPSVIINITDIRLLKCMSLLASIPFPESEPVAVALADTTSRASSMTINYLLDFDRAMKKRKSQPNPTVNLTQATSLEMRFEMKELRLTLLKKIEQNTIVKPGDSPPMQVTTWEPKRILKFHLLALEFEMLVQTYNQTMVVRLGGIGLSQYRGSGPIRVISTPMTAGSSKYLFDATYTKVDRKSPEFQSKYGLCEQLLCLNFNSLDLLLHQEGLQTLMELANEFQVEMERVNKVSETRNMDRFANTRLNPILEENIEAMKFKLQPKMKKRRKQKVEYIMFKLVAYLDEVNIKICNDERDLALLAIRGLETGVIVKKPYTQIIVKLCDMSVYDPNPSSTHKNIMEVTSDEAINVQVVMFNEDESTDAELEMSVLVQTGSVRIVFLNWFVQTLLKFLANFQTAQAAIISASAAAAETAKQNMQNVYTKAQRIQLSIRIKAPDIIIPVHSRSEHAMHVDLGHLTLNNSFINLNVTNDHGHTAIIDELNIQLENMKIARVKLNTDYTFANECVLLEPITFLLVIKRNLSSSWYKSIPDVDIAGRMKTIELSISQEDYKMVMQILAKNLQEGVGPTTASASLMEDDYPLSNESSSLVLGQVSGIINQDSTTDVPISTMSQVFLKFTFTMDSLICNLFGGGSRTMSPSSPVHDPSNGLARFSMDVLAIKGRILADYQLCVSIILVDCCLDDTRIGRQSKLTRLLQRCSDSGDLPSEQDVAKSMIDVTYQQNKSNMFIDVRVFSFNIILAMDYLMKISEFFANTTEPELDDNPISTVSTERHRMSTAASAKSRIKSNVSVHPKQQQQSAITLNLRIEKPDIILVDNLDTIDAEAMILNCEVVLKARLSDSHQVLSSTISDLTIYTCTYNPLLRQSSMHTVLRPLSINIAGSTPSGDAQQGLHLDVIVTNVRVSVSPSTIELLNRVMATMYASTDPSIEAAVESNDYSDLWVQKQFDETQFWFLRTEMAEEAEFWNVKVPSKLKVMPQNEMCMLNIPSIVVTLEAGIGSKTLPLILLEAGIQGTVGNWSTSMYFDSSVSLRMAYYNSKLAVWEPLLEPVEQIEQGKRIEVSWELKFEMQMNSIVESPTLSPVTADGEPIEEIPYQTPAQSIRITSKDNLELTITKTCLEVFNTLGKAFANAIKVENVQQRGVAPYEVHNDTGLDITLMLHSSSFQAIDNAYNEIEMQPGAKFQLHMKPDYDSSTIVQLLGDTESAVLSKSVEKTLFVKVKGMQSHLELHVMRADRRYFSLNHRGDTNDNWGLISDITVQDGCTIITLRSILQVHNHFDQAIEVYYMKNSGNEVELITTIEANGSVNLPVQSLYTPTYEIFFGRPGYAVSSVPFTWKDVQFNLAVTKLIDCRPKQLKQKSSFYIWARGEIEQVYHENTKRHTMLSACYHVHIRPAVSFRNCLPLSIIVCVSDSIEEINLGAGEMAHLPTVVPGTSDVVIRIAKYLDKEWSCKRNIIQSPPEFTVWPFDSYDGVQKATLDLGLHASSSYGSMILTLYCPFWMLNKTGLMLTYRNSEDLLNVLYHPETFKGPILFSFNSKNFFGKKKASIRIGQGEWSNKFSLDVAGSSGVVSCKCDGIVYQIGVHNQLTYNGLTKQVTFTPYFVLLNNAPFVVETQEVERPGDAWIRVPPGECTPLWPRAERDNKLLRAKVVGTKEITPPFLITEGHTTLLKLNNMHGGIYIDVHVTEGAIYITMSNYQPGLAPALIINQTSGTVKFWEKESINIRTIDSGQYMLYTWENPSGARTLVWDSGNKSDIEDDLRKDGIGEFLMPDAETEVKYWVSFLDGTQRVLLFTDYSVVAGDAQTAGELEPIQQEITVAIHGVGFSLVNNNIRKEIMYIGIASSGVIWETGKYSTDRYKPLNIKDCALIEMAYQRYLQQVETESNIQEARVLLDAKLEVDFEHGEMLRPHKRRLRRTFQTGLWMQMKTSPHQLQLHAKINRLQIDNQMHDCVFPVVLAPVPPPKSVAINHAQKPFAELSIVQRIMKHSTVQQFKYFKVLVQEFHVKVDVGFMNALLILFEQTATTESENYELFKKDLSLVDEPLLAHVSSQSLQEQKNFYDLLHFSPLKIHVSFSMQDGSGASAEGSSVHALLGVLLQGIGVTLTDMQDVVFRLAYFEREYSFLTQRQLVSEATAHYVGQSVKQLYVLVLGLDVIGNPYGLVLGITKGVEDLFYEPFQGAIQGPGEFAEGLVLGVRSLFGHTVGGAAGAVSRITGAMGKGIAALTFDDEYQRKRRDMLKKRPANIQEGIARGGKGLVMGVVDGVTGVFVKPISGAKEQGVEGFFKGLGKGALGLVTRPTAGVVDFASGSFDAVKRAAEVGDEIMRLRTPRFLKADGRVRTYCRANAEGDKLLMELEKGKYASTDIYVFHCWIVQRKDILLLTDKRVAYVIHNDIFGGWQVDWSYAWHEMPQMPRASDRGIYISLPETKRKVLGLFGSTDHGKLILLANPNVRQMVLDKMEKLFRGEL